MLMRKVSEANTLCCQCVKRPVFVRTDVAYYSILALQGTTNIRFVVFLLGTAWIRTQREIVVSRSVLYVVMQRIHVRPGLQTTIHMCIDAFPFMLL
jgi:hypothetical protein